MGLIPILWIRLWTFTNIWFDLTPILRVSYQLLRASWCCTTNFLFCAAKCSKGLMFPRFQRFDLDYGIYCGIWAWKRGIWHGSQDMQIIWERGPACCTLESMKWMATHCEEMHGQKFTCCKMFWVDVLRKQILLSALLRFLKIARWCPKTLFNYPQKS